MNPLKAAYAAKTGAGTPAATPAASPVRGASAPVSSAAAVAPVVQTTIAPAGERTRDLSALRARLAGGGLGGVNPPEAPAALTDTALDPKTEEVGGVLQPIGAPADSAAPAPDALPDGKAKRTRRTRAQIEADNAELARQTAGLGVAPAAEESALLVVLDRIATALETLASQSVANG